MLGIPSNQDWEGVEDQKLYSHLDQTKKTNNLKEYLTAKGVTDQKAVSLLSKMFTINPAQRIKID